MENLSTHPSKFGMGYPFPKRILVSVLRVWYRYSSLIIFRWRLTCPECRKQHHVSSEGIRTFPINKYIITFLTRSNRKELETCLVHDRDLSLFCKHVDCQRAICQRCYLNEHNAHPVVDIEDERKLSKVTLSSHFGHLKISTFLYILEDCRIVSAPN